MTEYVNIVEGSFGLLRDDSEIDFLVTLGFSSCSIHTVTFEKCVFLFHDNFKSPTFQLTNNIKELVKHFGEVKKIAVVNIAPESLPAYMNDDIDSMILQNKERAQEAYKEFSIDVEFLSFENDFVAISKNGDIYSDNNDIGISIEPLECTELDRIRFMINRVNSTLAKQVNMDFQFNGLKHLPPLPFVASQKIVEEIVFSPSNMELDFPNIYNGIMKNPDPRIRGMFKFYNP